MMINDQWWFLTMTPNDILHDDIVNDGALLNSLIAVMCIILMIEMVICYF